MIRIRKNNSMCIYIYFVRVYFFFIDRIFLVEREKERGVAGEGRARGRRKEEFDSSREKKKRIMNSKP